MAKNRLSIPTGSRLYSNSTVAPIRSGLKSQSSKTIGKADKSFRLSGIATLPVPLHLPFQTVEKSAPPTILLLSISLQPVGAGHH